MLATVLILILVLTVAFVQSTQGWYSAMIMAVLTVTCAALAFGMHDWVAVNLLAPYWKPSFAHAIAMAALFGVPLIILRLIFDRTIRRSSLLPLMVDRVGGGICGLVTSLTMVGVFAYTMQLLPFENGSILGYSRVDVADPSSDKPGSMATRDLWLSPDRFAAGLGTMLSSGLYSSGTSLYLDHPDLVQEAGWTNAVPAGMSRFVYPGSISIVGTEVLPELFKVVPAPDPKNNPPSYEPIEPTAGTEFRMVKVKLGDKARDENKSHLFTLRQFRLAGRKPGSASLIEMHAIGIQQEETSTPTNHYIRLKKARVDMPVVDNAYAPRSGEIVEVVFQVPKGFEPSHLSYKRGARVPITFKDDDQAPRESAKSETKTAAPSPTPASTAAAETASVGGRGENAPSRRRGGNIRGITTQAGKSFFGDALPLELKNYRGQNVELRAGAMASGSLVAEIDKQAEGTSPPIHKFAVPDDKRLLQLSMSKLEARSGLGRIISQAIGTVENYFVTDSGGNRYEVVGKYAVADVSGTQVLELQYFGGADAGVGRMQPFDRIKETHMKGEYGFVLLFLVKPGATITSFSSGGEASRQDDLTGDNLTAPP